jgi:hypothetical protein
MSVDENRVTGVGIFSLLGCALYFSPQLALIPKVLAHYLALSI